MPPTVPSGRTRVVLLVGVVVLLVAALAVLSGWVAAGRTVGFDDRLRVWFWPSGEWRRPQHVGDVVVEGLQPRVTVALLLVGAALVARRRRTIRPLLLSGAAVVLLAVGLYVLKSVVTRADLHGVDGSFPSGHEASIVVAVGTSAVAMHWPRRVAVPLLGVLALVMGAALLVTGTHWFTDVLGGALLGSIVLGVMLVVVDVLEAAPHRAREPAQPSDSMRSTWSATSSR